MNRHRPCPLRPARASWATRALALALALCGAPAAALARGVAEESTRLVGTLDPRTLSGGELALELFSGERLVFSFERTIEGARATTWVGSLPRRPGDRALLTLRDGLAFGSAHVDGTLYRIVGIGDPWEVREVAPATGDCALGRLPRERVAALDRLVLAEQRARHFEPGREGTAPQPDRQGNEGFAEAQDPGPLVEDVLRVRIDVLGVFTPEARARAWESLSPQQQHLLLIAGFGPVNGGAKIMEGWIEHAVHEAEDAFLNSGISVGLSLVHAQEIEKAEDEAGIADYLDWLKLAINVPGNQVWDLREQHAADLVSLWLSESGDDADACGIGEMLETDPWVPNLGTARAASVVDLDCLHNLSFAHEIGHNLGAAHDEYEVLNGGNPWPGYFDYSYGYVTQPWHPSLPKRRTVMAYWLYCEDNGFACPRIPHYSNPDVSFMGYKTGALKANNARTINRTGYYVSKHRPLVQPRPPVPTP